MLEGFVLSVDEMGVGSAMVGLSEAKTAMLEVLLRAVGNRAGVRFFRILLEATAPLPGGEGIEPHHRGVARIESSV